MASRTECHTSQAGRPEKNQCPGKKFPAAKFKKMMDELL